MKVGYHPVWPGIFLALGGANLILAVIQLDGGSTPYSVVLGPLFVLIGVLQLVRPYFEYDAGSGTLVVKALLGPMKRAFGGAKGDQLGVKEKRIVRTAVDGHQYKVPVQRFMSKPAEWDAVFAQIAGQPR